MDACTTTPPRFDIFASQGGVCVDCRVCGEELFFGVQISYEHCLALCDSHHCPGAPT